jgi:hypothetical protein
MMRPTDVAMALSPKARQMLLDLGKSGSLRVFRLVGAGFELTQTRLAELVPEIPQTVSRLGFLLHLTDDGREVLNAIAPAVKK